MVVYVTVSVSVSVPSVQPWLVRVHECNLRPYATSNTFCGTWNLPHSRCKVRRYHRAPRQQFSVRHRNFADSAVNYGGYIAYFLLRMREMATFHCDVKSDVTIEFLDPSFPYDAEISAIRS